MKKWFDKDCESLKQEVRRAGKEKHRKPHDNLLKMKYHEKLKAFKGKCRARKSLFWQNKLNEIEASLKDPKSFWKKWKNVNEVDTPHRTPNISGDRWFSHFSNLHTEQCEEILEDPPYKAISPEDQAEIDKPFSKKEFKTVIKRLKKAKASGFDGICNEMIINSPIFVLDLIHKFLNLCLQKSLVPNLWCREVINPIFKDGNVDDANNYRGICISSALLKILCTLLNSRLQEHCTRLNVINQNQIGFRKNSRTSDLY